MFDTLIKNFLPRIAQDLITSLVALLAAHGYITADQTQSTVGSLFFLAMLGMNYALHTNRKANAAEAGANAAGGAIDRPTAIAIAKGKAP